MKSKLKEVAVGCFAMCAAMLLPTLSLAQPTMRVAVPVDQYCRYNSVYDVGIGEFFDVVVLLDSDGLDVSGAAFNLSLMPPGVFQFDTVYPTRHSLDIGNKEAGDYNIAFGQCVPACAQRELVRFQAIDTTGALGNGAEFVMVVSGLGDTAGEPVFRDCAGVEHVAPMGGGDGGITGSGLLFPDGSLIFNPAPVHGVARMSAPSCDLQSQCPRAVPVTSATLSVLKSRFR